MWTGHKTTGVEIDQRMNFTPHIENICSKAGRQLGALGRIRRILDDESKLSITRSFIISNFNYCPLVWHFCSRKLSQKMECILKRALRFTYSDYSSDYVSLLTKAGLPSLELQRQRSMAVETFKILNGLSPVYLCDIVTLNNISHNTRQACRLKVPTVNSTTYGLHSVKCMAVKIWNELPREYINSDSLKSFKICMENWIGFKCKCSVCKHILR